MDDPGVYELLQAMRRMVVDVAATLDALGASGSAAASGVDDVVSILDYGGVGDGTTNNDAAFAAAEASTEKAIYIPGGVFITNRAHATFTKGYWGPGVVMTSEGRALPGTNTYLAAAPTAAPGTGVSGFFAGDHGLNRGEWKVVGVGARTQGASTIYFDRRFQGRSCWMYTYDGSSGFQTQSAVPRTNTPYDYIHVRNFGAHGDVYGSVVRMEQKFAPSAAQTHFFATTTVGQYGGDVNFDSIASGAYATGWESMYLDNGADVAVIAQVDSFDRTNDTGAKSVVWLGTMMKSEGSKPADCAHAVAGPWRIGLDTVRATFSGLGAGALADVAINTAKGQRWVMNSSTSNSGRGGDPTGTFPPFFGNVAGDMFIESGNDGTDYINIRYNRTAPNDARLRLRPSSLQCNKQINTAEAFNAGTDLSLGGQTGGIAIIVFGAGSGNQIDWDGTNFNFRKGGSIVHTI